MLPLATDTTPLKMLKDRTIIVESLAAFSPFLRVFLFSAIFFTLNIERDKNRDS
jgi:hypothetical protein